MAGQAEIAFMEDFEQLYLGKVDSRIPVYKYLAKRSGVRIVVAQVEGPLVNGFFCLGNCT